MMRNIIATKFAFVFLIAGAIGVTLRSIRNEWLAVPGYVFDSMNNNIIVAIEHLLAGIGMPAFISLFFLLLSWVGNKRVQHHSWRSTMINVIDGSAYYWSVILFASAVYVIHIVEHEMRQAPPVNGWQIVAGMIGVAIFLIFALTQSKHSPKNDSAV